MKSVKVEQKSDIIEQCPIEIWQNQKSDRILKKPRRNLAEFKKKSAKNLTKSEYNQKSEKFKHLCQNLENYSDEKV